MLIMMDYYVMIASNTDEINTMYGELNNKSDTQLVMVERKKIINRYTTRLLSPETQRHKTWIANMITKSIYKKQIQNIVKFKISEKICFMITARIYELYGKSMIDFIKQRYWNSEVICYLGDIVESYSVGIDKFLTDFDRVYTYDYGDAKKYSLLYCIEPFSYKYKINKKPKYDITFVGKAKNRTKQIIKIYEKLIESGLKCDFHVIEVSENEQQYPDDITYNVEMTFDEIIENVINAKCVLEVVQEGALSPTTRFAEAMLYHRNLLTNCEAFKNSLFEKENNIFFFNYINDIDVDFITKEHSVDWDKYIDFFSLERFVQVMLGNDQGGNNEKKSDTDIRL